MRNLKNKHDFSIICGVNNKKNTKGKGNRPPVDYGACLVTRHILDEGMKVGFMYREVPEDDFDSGWRFLSGKEDDEYMEQEQNSFITDVDMVIVLDNAIRHYLHLPFGTELERVGDKFVALEE